MLFPNLKELVKLKAAIGKVTLSRVKPQNNAYGNYTSILHGIGVEFETIRPYVVGDDVRYIDWRTTARTGKAQVKTFRAECDRNVFIVVDANAYMRFGTRGTFKSIQAARVAAISAWRSMQAHDRVGGLVFGDVERGMQYFKPSKSDSAALKILNLLCNKETDVHNPVTITDALKHLANIITPQSVVIVVSDFSVENIDDLKKSLLQLRQFCDLMLIPIYDPIDVEMPNVGTIICSNGENQQLVHTSDSNARKVYHQLWLDYYDNLSILGKKLRIPIRWIETTIDPVRQLWKS